MRSPNARGSRRELAGRGRGTPCRCRPGRGRSPRRARRRGGCAAPRGGTWRSRGRRSRRRMLDLVSVERARRSCKRSIASSTISPITAHEVVAVVADVDADRRRQRQPEQLDAEDQAGAGAARARGVDQRRRLGRASVARRAPRRSGCSPSAPSAFEPPSGIDVRPAAARRAARPATSANSSARRAYVGAADPAHLGADQPVEQDVGLGRRGGRSGSSVRRSRYERGRAAPPPPRSRGSGSTARRRR